MNASPLHLSLLSTMRQITAFLSFIFIFGQSLTLMAYASPMTINPAPKARSSPYVKGVVILLALSLAFLFVAKWAYQSRRYRQTSFNPEYSWRARSLRSQPDVSLFASEDVFPKIPKKKGKSGLLVGLFGSPSWETRYSIIQMASEQISLNRALHLTITPHNNGSNYRFTVSPQHRRAEDLSFERSNSINLSKAEPGLRTFCEPLLVGPPPVMTSNTYPPWNLTRPVSSHASSDLRRQSSRFEPLLDSTVRLIPDCSACWIVDFPESMHSSTPSFHDSHFSSLPNCKCIYAHSWDSRVRPTPRAALESNPHFSHTSNRSPHPKALQTILYGDAAAVKQADSICLIPPPINSSMVSPFKQLTNSNSVQGCDESFSSKHNWSMPILGSRYTFDALELSAKRENAKTFTLVHVSATDVDAIGVVKPNLRTSSFSQQQKLSPKVRPSPLRTTFLHDSGETYNKSPRNYSQSRDILAENLISIDSESVPRSDSRFIDSAKLSCARQRKPNRYETKLRAKSFKERTKNQDSESLFDLIQELVQETNAWDDSLFVDHKFKAMIDDSKQVITVSLAKKHEGWRRSHRLRRPNIRILEGIPEMEAEIALEEDEVAEH